MTAAFAFSFNETDDCGVSTTESTNESITQFNESIPVYDTQKGKKNEGNQNSQNENLQPQTPTEDLKFNNNDNNNTLPCKNFTEQVEQTVKEKSYINDTIVHNGPVLTYLLKNDIDITVQKTKGHEKNSLRRKKRSDINYRYGERPPKGQSKILNNDYKSSYQSRPREYTQPLHNRAEANVIQSSNLADFNIETLHENKKSVKNNPENVGNERYRVPHYDYFRNDRKGTRGSLRYEPKDTQNRNKYQESDESEEKNKYNEKVKTTSHESDNPEISDRNYSENNRDDISSSQQYSTENTDKDRNEPRYKQGSKYQDNQEIKEEENLRPNYKSDYNQRSGVSNERESSKENKSSDENETATPNRESYTYNRNNKPYSGERSNSNEELSNAKNTNDKSYDQFKHRSRGDSNSKPPVAIQDIDLGDFSYERIKVNDRGQVESVQDADENNDESSIKIVSNNSKQRDKVTSENNERYTSSQKTTDQPYRRDKSEEAVPINDGEIKPVVELNSESEELNNDDRRQKQNLDLNDDTNLRKELPKNADVKQQFEKIPLNYDHTKQEKIQNSKDAEVQRNSEDITDNKNNQNIGNDETLETLSATTARYDENLNIKFDDISIKLPEIKLPDDILAYNFDDDRDDEEQYYKEEKDDRSKQNNKYSDDKNEDGHYRQNDDDDDENDGGRRFSGFYENDEEKQNYQDKKNPEDEEGEDVDLYEKFVRERFGKRGSFEKRSENLQEDARKLPENPKLYEKLQNILKKTEDTQKEAEKSGDPNAGYMWTLEYGENL